MLYTTHILHRSYFHKNEKKTLNSALIVIITYLVIQRRPEHDVLSLEFHNLGKKLNFLIFFQKLNMRHTFWSWLIMCVSLKWIWLVLWKIQSRHNFVYRQIDRQTDGQTDGQSKTSIPTSTSLVRGIINEFTHFRAFACQNATTVNFLHAELLRNKTPIYTSKYYLVSMNRKILIYVKFHVGNQPIDIKKIPA